MKVTGRRFEGKTIRLDGNQYEGCTFVRCTLDTACTVPFKLTDCVLSEGTRVRFVGPGKNTLDLLAALWADPNSRHMVEAIFEVIRSGNALGWDFTARTFDA